MLGSDLKGMSCRAFFQTLPVEQESLKGRCKLIDDAYPDGVCQLESVSAESPGTVNDEEFAHRYVFSPIHIENGVIKTAFFSDCQYGGLSCQRSPDEHPDQEVHDSGQAQVDGWNEANKDPGKARSYLGAVTAKVSSIRTLEAREDAVQLSGDHALPMMAVYDTAKVGDERHIDVFQIAGPARRADLKQARRDLALVFSRKPASAAGFTIDTLRS